MNYFQRNEDRITAVMGLLGDLVLVACLAMVCVGVLKIASLAVGFGWLFCLTFALFVSLVWIALIKSLYEFCKAWASAKRFTKADL